MKKDEFEIKKKMIKETFDDERPIKCITPPGTLEVDDEIHQGGDIFITEDGDYIDLEYQLNDFDEEELVKYVEFAEELYEKTKRHISIYLMCPKNVNVCVREFEIKSQADFTIRLACIGYDPCQMILNEIKQKMKRGEYLDCKDIEILENLPVRCAKKDRNYFRLECFKIINRMTH